MARLALRWTLLSVAFAWFLLVAGGSGHAQQVTLRARTTLVEVPTLVESPTGEPIFNLAAKDFLVKDNGVEQTIHLDTETDKAPLSIVVLVQVGGSAVREFQKYIGLPTMVRALAGDTQHRTAVVEFDSQPRMLQNFTSNSDAVQQAIYSIQPGDDGAAILDSLWYAVDMLNDEPQQNQRVVLLLSETRDHGSRTPAREVVRKVGRSNVIVYSLAFSPGRGDLFDFSHAGDGPDLLAPLRLAVQALRRNAAAAIPKMTGGQYLRFNHAKQLENEIGMLANQVHNRYILSFQPTDATPGLHVLTVALLQPLPGRVLARTNYWAIGAPPPAEEKDSPSVDH